jgi:hypothetical protein
MSAMRITNKISFMRQSENEERIRDLWRALPERHREGIIDVFIFKGDIVQHRPDLLEGVDGSLNDYFLQVLAGLYKTKASKIAQQ